MFFRRLENMRTLMDRWREGAREEQSDIFLHRSSCTLDRVAL